MPMERREDTRSKAQKEEENKRAFAGWLARQESKRQEDMEARMRKQHAEIEALVKAQDARDAAQEKARAQLAKEQRGARSSLDNQVGDIALLFMPLLFGAVGQLVSHAAAFWLGAGVMIGANVLIAQLLKDGDVAAEVAA